MPKISRIFEKLIQFAQMTAEPPLARIAETTTWGPALPRNEDAASRIERFFPIVGRCWPCVAMVTACFPLTRMKLGKSNSRRILSCELWHSRQMR